MKYRLMNESMGFGDLDYLVLSYRLLVLWKAVQPFK
jgi:hypothetical protein